MIRETSQDPSNALSVVSYNIHKGLVASNTRMALRSMRDRLHALAPDIVLIQEIVGRNQQMKRRFADWPIGTQLEFLADQMWPHNSLRPQCGVQVGRPRQRDPESLSDSESREHRPIIALARTAGDLAHSSRRTRFRTTTSRVLHSLESSARSSQTTDRGDCDADRRSGPAGLSVNSRRRLKRLATVGNARTSQSNRRYRNAFQRARPSRAHLSLFQSSTRAGPNLRS